MKRRWLLAFIGLAVRFALPTFGQQTHTPDPQTTQKILAIGEAYNKAVSNNDAIAIAALYMEGAVFVTDRGPVGGRQAIEKWYAGLYQGWHPKNHTTTLDGDAPHLIATTGDAAWATGAWSETGQAQSGEPIQIQGYWSAVYCP
jgi:ketosteroid isomerase-like protein